MTIYRDYCPPADNIIYELCQKECLGNLSELFQRIETKELEGEGQPNFIEQWFFDGKPIFHYIGRDYHEGEYKS